ncbi:CotH protein [[Clostridium] methylpentosum DSM 5476]|uniref:CotH protein n=1 Tax=[Clostridium] methylpentosum DSM 5476 TaxID=537013 RepID=C0EC42_9FIRM|nr:CotH protein [[Clostridium] methylpentosum DSM 5476]MEE1491847.1 CotH kinase family protein [Massilioclostridium sp.]
MITSKRLTALVAVLMAVALALTGTLVVLAHTAGSVSVPASTSLTYATSLFNKDTIMTVDITVDPEEWESMLQNAVNEEYISCDITINGTTYSQVGIRPKGNTSLTSIASSDSDRYSFKVEFDHYVKGQTCDGLDKLVLNNTMSDATYMKEYLSYDMMSFMGVTSPLYSFANITVNGEAWGCYLAIEALEESFALRNYGTSYGQLYKPEGMEMGGGMGGGEVPQMGGFPKGGKENGQGNTESGSSSTEGAQAGDAPLNGMSPPGTEQLPDSSDSSAQAGNSVQPPGGQGSPPSMGQMPGSSDSSAQIGDSVQPPGGQGSPPSMGQMPGSSDSSAQTGDSVQPPGGQGSLPSMGQMPGSSDSSAQTGDSVQPPDGQGSSPSMGQMPGNSDDSNTSQSPANDEQPDNSQTQENGTNAFSGRAGGGFPGSSSSGGSDLSYTDDNVDSYSDIFDNAVFDADESDYQRVIEALEALNTGSNLERYVDVDQVLRYFAVNTVLVNLDSYVSSMKHNYYLYENNGQISILPWDFNLAFAGFQSNSASSAVNFPIDTPVQGVDLSERPLLGKLLEVEEYSHLYHAYLQKIVTEYFDSGLFENTIRSLDSLIGSSVQNDPTALYTYEEYTNAVENLILFGTLRSQSVQGQLDGTIPSTSEGQQQDASSLIDASDLSITAMGTQGGGEMGGRNRGDENTGGFQGGEQGDSQVPPNMDDAITPGGDAEAEAGLPDRATMEQVMQILGGSTDGSLTEDQREQLAALGITDEMIEQFQSRTIPAMQGGMPQENRMGGAAPGEQRTQSSTAPSIASILIVSGCAAAAIAGVLFVLFFPKRKLHKGR